ncbi:MAG: hypothetical protein Aureis2KO_17090 [Aureisphaera sp.]
MEKNISYVRAVSIIFMVVVSLTLLATNYLKDDETTYRSEIAQLSDSPHWYYEIYENNKLIIKQKHIPGVKGLQGFQSQDEARKVASKVMEKLENGNFPTISPQELEELSITFKNQ